MPVMDIVARINSAKHKAAFAHRGRVASLKKHAPDIKLKREKTQIRIKAHLSMGGVEYTVTLNGRLYAVAETKSQAKVIAARVARKRAGLPEQSTKPAKRWDDGGTSTRARTYSSRSEPHDVIAEARRACAANG